MVQEDFSHGECSHMLVSVNVSGSEGIASLDLIMFLKLVELLGPIGMQITIKFESWHKAQRAVSSWCISLYVTVADKRWW